MSEVLRKVAHRLVMKTLVPDALIRRKRTSKLEGLPPVEVVEKALARVSPRPAPAFGKFAFVHHVECDLSVIVPVYNTEKYVGECLDSVLSRDVDFDMEVIAVNDGSTDGSLGVLRDRASRDSRVRIINQDNRGFSGARNVGVDQSRGGGALLC